MKCLNKDKFKGIDNQGVWFVYKIISGEKFYIGHASNLPKTIVEQERNKLIEQDFNFQIYAYCEDRYTCRSLYKYLLKRYSDDENCLNGALKAVAK